MAIIEHPARAIDDTVTARKFRPVKSRVDGAVFEYVDTNSSRAGINTISSKLAGQRVGIVGIGGTGSYILDLVAKTPVAEIHLFDGDLFLNHNAFRAPGAASFEDLKKSPHKVTHFTAIYSRMHRGIHPHAYHISQSNIVELLELDFVFLCFDGGKVKKAITIALEEAMIPFIDVGMGIICVESELIGTLRVTASTNSMRDSARSRIPVLNAEDNEYSTNIQIADLNALNAALAVIKWKKLLGFYQDLVKEHFCVYTLNDNELISEDCPS